ncbi:hypothetical protein [Ornithinimicrobium avium]|uniref:hypothetical protein n=1 Tax=Ornithinimicrobium avium TaxID=2283195 RepID=UPI0013B3C8F6|nr:hypothetical protein [Ornithinimicrobium avium]
MGREGMLTGVLTAYRDARGDEQDQRWAQDVVALMVLEGVAGAATRRELEEALTLVRESGEGPAALYGDPREWARTRLREAPEEGRVLVDGTPDTSWRDALVVGCVVAALLTFLVMIMVLVKDGWTTDYSWGWMLFPLASGLMCTLALATWERALLRRPRWVAVAAAGAVVLGGVAGATWLVMGADRVVATASSFAWAALVLGYVLLASLLDRVLPEREGRRTTRPLDDEEWERRLAGTLRMRMDLGEARVRDIVHEARTHAAETGRALAEEFGDPAVYAARFERDRPARLRRAAWAQTAMVALAVLIVVLALVDGPRDGWNTLMWAGGLMCLVSMWSAVDAWRKVHTGARVTAAAPPGG